MPALIRSFSALLVGLPLCSLVGDSWLRATDQDPSEGPPLEDPLRAVRAGFEAGGIAVDPERGLVSIEAEVAVVNELLEYLLVNPHGALHETLFATRVDAELLNTALLLLGLAPGTNADWAPKDPPPSQEELEQGVLAYEVEPPAGDGLYLYVGWREGDELHFFRMEDLVRDRFRGKSLGRHRFVYLGSHLLKRSPEGPEVFAASADGNLINISFFRAGSTLLTAALPECVDQSAWLANAWLLPPPGTTVRIFFCKERIEPALEGLPALPVFDPAAPPAPR